MVKFVIMYSFYCPYTFFYCHGLKYMYTTLSNFCFSNTKSFKSVSVSETPCQSDFFTVKVSVTPSGTLYIVVVNCVCRFTDLGVKFTQHGEDYLIDLR